MDKLDEVLARGSPSEEAQASSPIIGLYQAGQVRGVRHHGLTGSHMLQHTELVVEVLRVTALIMESCASKNLNFYNSTEVCPVLRCASRRPCAALGSDACLRRPYHCRRCSGCSLCSGKVCQRVMHNDRRRGKGKHEIEMSVSRKRTVVGVAYTRVADTGATWKTAKKRSCRAASWCLLGYAPGEFFGPVFIVSLPFYIFLGLRKSA